MEEKKGDFTKDYSKLDSIPGWYNYTAVSKFRSIKRAIRRGHVDMISGMIYPNRPFNNRKPTRGRKFNELKKSIHEAYKRTI